MWMSVCITNVGDKVGQDLHRERVLLIVSYYISVVKNPYPYSMRCFAFRCSCTGSTSPQPQSVTSQQMPSFNGAVHWYLSP